jgi:hypothetical protein
MLRPVLVVRTDEEIVAIAASVRAADDVLAGIGRSRVGWADVPVSVRHFSMMERATLVGAPCS